MVLNGFKCILNHKKSKDTLKKINKVVLSYERTSHDSFLIYFKHEFLKKKFKSRK